MNNVVRITCNAVTLADGTRTGGRCGKLEINGAAVTETVAAIRALWLQFLDRYNKSNDVQFTITTQHASAIAAMTFHAKRIEAIGGVRNLVITYSDGTDTLTITATSAAWTATRGDMENLSSVVTYSVKCGQLAIAVNGSPASGADFALPLLDESAISPLIIPAGTTATVGAGKVLVAFSLQVDGALIIDPLADVYLLAA